MVDLLLNNGWIDVPVQKTDGAFFELILVPHRLKINGAIVGLISNVTAKKWREVGSQR